MINFKNFMIAAVGKQDEEGNTVEGELSCFGDSEFVNESLYKVLGNKDLFLNTMEWLARDEKLISIRRDAFEYPYQFLYEEQGRLVFWIFVIVHPSIFLVIGVVIFISRRTRR